MRSAPAKRANWSGGQCPVAEENPVVRAEAQRESHRQATTPPSRSAPLQPANRPSLPAQRGLPTILEIQLAILGGHVPGLLVLANHALAYRTHEKDRPDATQAPPAANELFQGKKAVFQRCGRGTEQQSQSHHEKIVWLSYLPRPGTRALSHTWQTTRAATYPRILLTSHLLCPEADRAQVINRQMRQGPAGNLELEVERPTQADRRKLGRRQDYHYADNPGQIRTRANALEAGKHQTP